MSATETDGSEEGGLCYKCYSDQPDGSCGHVVNASYENLIKERCEMGCEVQYSINIHVLLAEQS